MYVKYKELTVGTLLRSKITNLILLIVSIEKVDRMKRLSSSSWNDWTSLHVLNPSLKIERWDMKDDDTLDKFADEIIVMM